MNKLLTVVCAMCLGVFGFSSAAMAGFSADHIFDCATDTDTNLSDYFCKGTDLYEVNLHCWNLDVPIDGSLEIDLGGGYEFLVEQADRTDAVCNQRGTFIHSVKTESKCTDAEKGSNKPGKNKPSGFDEAGFEIKNLGFDESCVVL